MICVQHKTVSDLAFGFMMAAAAGSMMLVAKECTGCAPPSAPLSAAGYEAEQLACIVEAGTKQDADECRCSVQARYGRTCTSLISSSAAADAGGAR